MGGPAPADSGHAEPAGELGLTLDYQSALTGGNAPVARKSGNAPDVPKSDGAKAGPASGRRVAGSRGGSREQGL